MIRSVYLSVNSSEIQNCRSPQALMKLLAPMNFGGVISDQLWNETTTICTSGQKVKTATKSSAGAR